MAKGRAKWSIIAPVDNLFMSMKCTSDCILPYYKAQKLGGGAEAP